MTENIDTQKKRKWFTKEPALSCKEKGVIENIWLSVSVVIWSIALAPLEIRTVSNAGLEEGSMEATTIKLFLFGIGLGFFFRWKFELTFVESRYILLLNFIYAFFLVLLSVIARALLIAEYGI